MGKYIYTLGRKQSFFWPQGLWDLSSPDQQLNTGQSLNYWITRELPKEEAILTKHKTQHTLCVWQKTYKQSRKASELWQNTFATDIIKFYTLFYFKYICISVCLSYLNTDKYFKYIYIHTKNLQISKKNNPRVDIYPYGVFLID